MLNKPIKVILLSRADEALVNLESKIQKKFFLLMEKIEHGAKPDDFKKLTEAIWELKADGDGKFYRMFAFWDKKGANETLIVCTHLYQKKSNKTSKNEIETAIQLMNEYMGNPKAT